MKFTCQAGFEFIGKINVFSSVNIFLNCSFNGVKIWITFFDETHGNLGARGVTWAKINMIVFSNFVLNFFFKILNFLFSKYEIPGATSFDTFNFK